MIEEQRQCREGWLGRDIGWQLEKKDGEMEESMENSEVAHFMGGVIFL